MKSLYYLASNVYQYSYVKPVYRYIGGQFVVHKPRTILQLKRSFWGFDSRNPSRGLLGLQPKTIKCPYYDYTGLSGLLVATNNTDSEWDRSKLTIVFIGHGSGDKPYNPEREIRPFDYYLVSGEKQKQIVRNEGNKNLPDDRFIEIGNTRFDDVINDNIDKGQVYKTLGIKDHSRKNILFAPTRSQELWGKGTLLTHGFDLIRKLNDEYNLIIRPHYYDWRNLGPLTEFIKEGGYDHTYLIDPRYIGDLDTMENLAIVDLLITDISSIMYEFLIYQRPVILIDVEHDLIPMPDEMNMRKVVDHWDEAETIHDLVEDNLAENKYKDELHQLLHNCFYFNDGTSGKRAADAIQKLRAG